jgi:hypothetical protein
VIIKCEIVDNHGSSHGPSASRVFSRFDYAFLQ